MAANPLINLSLVLYCLLRKWLNIGFDNNRPSFKYMAHQEIEWVI